MPTKKKQGRKDLGWSNMCVRLPSSMVDALDEERQKLLLSDRSTLVRQILDKHLKEKAAEPTS